MTQQRGTLTKPVAYAAGQDAGNRAMRAAGRSSWNRSDYNRAKAKAPQAAYREGKPVTEGTKAALRVVA